MSKRITRFDSSMILRKKAQSMIPGGSHTYAKGDDQYPLRSPSHMVRGRGCRAWDVDGNEFIEYGMGNRAVTLGHAFPPVLDAVRQEIERGVNFSRPAAIEVTAAERLLRVLDTDDMVKFCKDGSDATSAAVKVARAYTGRDLIAICADHPFFSVDDWFIGATAMHGGIPEATRKMTVKFRYNDIGSVKALLESHKGQIAGFILEPMRADPPQNSFLQELKRLAHEAGALLIIDEMITGFRMHLQGGQRLLGVDPDLSTWGKALANGFSVSALSGKREYMRLGDLHQTDKPRVFLLSTTHGGETHALAAMMATLDVYQAEPVIEHLDHIGRLLRRGLEEAITRHGLQQHVAIQGPGCNLFFSTLDADKKPSQAFRTLLLQEAIARGVIMPSLVVSYSHKEPDIDETVDAVDGALAVYAQALADGVEKYLIGPPSIPVYRTFNPHSG